MIMEKTQENICCKLCNYTVVLEERLNEFYERKNHRKK